MYLYHGSARCGGGETFRLLLAEEEARYTGERVPTFHMGGKKVVKRGLRGDEWERSSQWICEVEAKHSTTDLDLVSRLD
jgi:hypothetical protein